LHDSQISEREAASDAPVGTPGRGEILLAGLLTLAGITALLLRLPYRAPFTNSLWTTLGLIWVYLYPRLRLGIRMPAGVLLCLVFSVLIDVIGNRFGLFSQRIASIPYDIITHFVASGLSLVFVMWFLAALISRFGYRLPLGFVAFFSATTTFSLTAYYEITELMDERLLGGHRIWTPRDTSQDLAADLVGIIIAAMACALVYRKSWPGLLGDPRQARRVNSLKRREGGESGAV
jgi:hypothetical protein